MFRFLSLIFSILVLAGCASALGDAQQKVEFVTPGANDAVCLISNGETKYKIYTPGKITLSKRPGNLVVHCLADGNREKTVTIDPGHASTALGNAVTGFIPGIFVDYSTGALFEYPNTVSVDFTDIEPTSMPLPNYHKHLMENPHLFGMEEFRSGRAALIRDKYEQGFSLKKRELPGSGDYYSQFQSVPSGDEAVSTDSGASAAEPTASSEPAASNNSDMVSDLTKQMNPQVFGPSSGGFAGGTTVSSDGDDGSVASTGPVSIYPVER